MLDRCKNREKSGRHQQETLGGVSEWMILYEEEQGSAAVVWICMGCMDGESVWLGMGVCSGNHHHFSLSLSFFFGSGTTITATTTTFIQESEED